MLGVDMLAGPLDTAKRSRPDIQLAQGYGDRLPLTDASFDIVMQFTVLTSILDSRMRVQLASEMWRVLRPGGAIISYDFRFNNPGNPNVRGVGAREMRRLFRHGRTTIRSVTLLPPIARRLARYSVVMCMLLGMLPPLRSHLLVFVEKDPL